MMTGMCHNVPSVCTSVLSVSNGHVPTKSESRQDTGRRMDGRSLTDVRPITSRAGPLLRCGWPLGAPLLPAWTRRHAATHTCDEQPIVPSPPPTPSPLRTHGSVLFTRGETQALCVATLGSKLDALRAETIRGDGGGGGGDESGARFYLQVDRAHPGECGVVFSLASYQLHAILLRIDRSGHCLAPS